MHPLIRAWGEQPLQSRRTGQTAWQWMFCYSEIPVQMTLGQHHLSQLLRTLSQHQDAQCGKRLQLAAGILGENGQDARYGQERLLALRTVEGAAQQDIFTRNCFVVAYPEDDVKGVDRANRLRGLPGDGLGLSACRGRGDAEAFRR